MNTTIPVMILVYLKIMITRRTSFYEFISVGGFTIKSAHQRMYFLLQLSNGDENSEDKQRSFK